MRRFIIAIATITACTDEAPAWQLECEALTGEVRADACKEACGSGSTCPGAEQYACELECRTCTPEVAWCPAVAE